ncbi:putative glycoside hydrolase [Methanobrevibacter sp.]
MNFGYWVFGADMKKVNLENLRKNGTTDLFLNYYAFTAHGEKEVLAWIEKAKNVGINVHIWMQCFYDGEWHNPKTSNLSPKVAEAMKYAHMKNVAGVHLDYLRYPGNAYKTSGGADAITAFVKQVKSAIPKDIILSCAVMPENETKYYYGQDIEALGKIVDVIIPMQYKGNYNAGASWLTSTTKEFSSKATIWSGLQSYKSDDNPVKLPGVELLEDVKTCLAAGAKGAIMFRYGLVGNLNYKSLVPKGAPKEVPKTETKTTATEVKEVSKTIKNSDIYTLANTVKTGVEKNKKLESSFKVGNVSYTSSEVAYAFSYAINNLSSDCTIPSLKAYASDTGDSMNEQVIPSDVKDQAKRIVQYIKQNGQCPAYVTTVKSKKRASVKMFVYAFARTLVWYKNHSKTFPNYTTYDTSAFSSSSTSTTSNGLYSYMTSQGCSGMGQCNGYNCGPNSLQQCFYRLTGIKVAESTIASWAGTTTSGTDHEGLNTAVAKFNKTYGTNIKITWKNFSELGSSLDARCKALQSYIDKGAVFVHLLYRNQYGHYEVVKSATSDPLSILNSLGDKCSSPAYCGYIESRSRSTQQSYINGISQKSIAILTK